MSTLPTPRTDALVLQHGAKLDEAIAARSFADGIRTRNSFIDAISHLAMELERELAEAKAERDALKEKNLERGAMLENQWITIKSAHVMLSVGRKEGLGRLGTEAEHAMAALAKGLYRPTAEEFRYEQAEAVRKACANIRANEEMHKAYAHQMQEERSAIAEHCKSLEADLSRWRALAEELAEALERCFGQLHDQQAMPDDSGDHTYKAALAHFRDAANPAYGAAITPVIQRKE